MTLQPVRSIREYKRLKESLKGQFERERTGEQGVYEEQRRLFQPLINSNEENAKKNRYTNASFLPITEAAENVTRELKRRNDRVDMLAELPFFAQEQGNAAITFQEGKVQKRKRTETKQGLISVDLDKYLGKSDRKALGEMGMPLPSEAYERGEVEEVLRKIKRTKNSLVQKTSRVSKAIPADKEAYEKQKASLGVLETHLQGIKKALVFVSSPRKEAEGAPTLSSGRAAAVQSNKQILDPGSAQASTTGSKGSGLRKRKGRVVDVVFYRSARELGKRLALLAAAKRAGNNGVENEINAVLDELLRIKVLTKERYDSLYREIYD